MEYWSFEEDKSCTFCFVCVVSKSDFIILYFCLTWTDFEYGLKTVSLSDVFVVGDREVTIFFVVFGGIDGLKFVVDGNQWMMVSLDSIIC